MRGVASLGVGSQLLGVGARGWDQLLG